MEQKDATYLKHKGYVGSVEVSLEDNCLYGKVLGLNKMLLSYEGSIVEELRTDFEDAVDDYLEMCQEYCTNPQTPTL